MIPILYRVGIDTMMLSRHVTSLVLNRRRCGQHKTIKTNQEGLVNGRNNTKKKKKKRWSVFLWALCDGWQMLSFSYSDRGEEFRGS